MGRSHPVTQMIKRGLGVEKTSTNFQNLMGEISSLLEQSCEKTEVGAKWANYGRHKKQQCHTRKKREQDSESSSE